MHGHRIAEVGTKVGRVRTEPLGIGGVELGNVVDEL